MNKDLKNIWYLYEFKRIYRATTIDCRFESDAEHVYGCLILAEYFLPKMRSKLNKERVYSLVLHHDLIEIETLDVGFWDKDRHDGKKKEMEKLAQPNLIKKIPADMRQKAVKYLEEYENQKAPESKFVKAIDKLEALTHQIKFTPESYNKMGITAQMHKERLMPHFKKFPLIKKFAEEIYRHAAKEGYLK